MPEHPTTEADDDDATNAVIWNTEGILRRAAEIDPAAWASPLPDRLQKRRNRSYAQAAQEFKQRGK